MQSPHRDSQRGPAEQPRRAALYVRVSTAKRAIKGSATDFEQDPAVQEMPLRALVAQRGWLLINVDSRVSEPTRSARMTSDPVPLTVAPVTRSPAPFSTGIGSPVIIDSSTLLIPYSTTPSTGTFSPGRTRSRAPTCTWSKGTSASEPSSRTRRAVFGVRPRRALMAAPV